MKQYFKREGFLIASQYVRPPNYTANECRAMAIALGLALITVSLIQLG